MPPDGYTTITIPEETAEKLAQLMIQHELETMPEAVEHAVESTLTNDSLSDAELAQLLYQRLRSSDTHA
jgi:hypothetical protein